MIIELRLLRKSRFQGDRKGAPLPYREHISLRSRSMVGAHPCGRPGTSPLLPPWHFTLATALPMIHKTTDPPLLNTTYPLCAPIRALAPPVLVQPIAALI